MSRIVRRIKPAAPALPTRKRVAAYARVSSGKEAMLHSLAAQVSYYSDYIQRHPGWAYVGVYADEALSGTKDSRAEFQRMLADCRSGKFDLVITKSISRFARNTVTLLEVVRELKSLNIEVFFEKENIHSLSGEGELMLTILASFAQEESLSVSENCKWRIKDQFKQGNVYSTTMLGYRVVDGTLEIVPEEAEIVKMIFTDFLTGMGKTSIVNKLLADGVLTRRNGVWFEKVIYQMLRNEKYAGDLILQKTFVPSHMDKMSITNKGQLPKYLIKDNHEAIIERDVFDRVQQELARRALLYAPRKIEKATYPFTGKMICGTCEKHYRRKISNAGSMYAKPVWICSTFNSRGKTACDSQQIPEDILMATTAEVLGLAAFDEAIFRKIVSNIEVVGPNALRYIFSNCTIIEKEWQHHSRRESWDEGAKQLAREKALLRGDTK